MSIKRLTIVVGSVGAVAPPEALTTCGRRSGPKAVQRGRGRCHRRGVRGGRRHPHRRAAAGGPHPPGQATHRRGHLPDRLRVRHRPGGHRRSAPGPTHRLLASTAHAAYDSPLVRSRRRRFDKERHHDIQCYPYPCRRRRRRRSKDRRDRLSTGILALDLALDGGLPLGSLVEISGKHHSGKTTVALQVLGQAQRAGLGACYLCGTRLPPAEYLAACGIDVEALHVPAPDDTATLEMALQMAVQTLAEGAVVVLDPLPAFPTWSELEAEEYDPGRKYQRPAILDAFYAIASTHLRRDPRGCSSSSTSYGIGPASSLATPGNQPAGR